MNILSPDVYIHTLNPFAIHFTGSYGIRWYGLAYLAGFTIAYYTILFLAKRGLSFLKPELVSDFVFTAALGTVIGGRLGYCIFYSPELFLKFTSSIPFWGVLAINEGGMASHGGIIGILVACAWFGKKHNIPILHLFDLTTLGGTAGIFFGRIANFVNGELVGRPVESSVPWAVKFPQDIMAWPIQDPERLGTLGNVVTKIGVPNENWQSAISKMRMNDSSWGFVQHTLARLVEAVQSGNASVTEALAPLLTARHPSQLYEALLEGAFLFISLVFLWRKPLKPGVIAGSFFVLYAIVRIIGEQFRMPDAQIGYQLLGLTRGQWLSIAMLALGSIALFVWQRRNTAPIGGWCASSVKLPLKENV
ncbi:MAG: prolipoprotein diacylglyceryl transferase [Deltaproteobacteria bacterium]|nr:prolipoprotein diacylglyceryl transferase [Deltaproteobacteria bacterium]